MILKCIAIYISMDITEIKAMKHCCGFIFGQFDWGTPPPKKKKLTTDSQGEKNMDEETKGIQDALY